MAIRTYGPNAVDWEQRIDLDRLRDQRLARLKDALDALRPRRAAHLRLRQHPVHDVDPHRHLGDGQADPVRAAAPRRRAGGLGLRLGGPPPPALQPVAGRRRSGPGPGSPRCAARSTRTPASPRRSRARSHAELGDHGLADEPLGVDLIEMPVLAALQGKGLTSSTASRSSSRPAGSRPPDEIALLDPGLLDGRRRLRRAVRVPAAGRTRERVRRPGQQGALRPRQRVRRGRQRDLRGALLAAPARLQRPDHPPRRPGVLRHPAQPPRATAPATTAASRSAARRRRMRDAYIRCREYMDRAIALVRPGATTADIVSVWPTRARSSASPNEEAAFALQYGHGVGLSIWEKPIFSRLVSLDHPEVLEEGMVFALETYWPAADGWSAARIEEEVVVTADGCEVITKFPAEELLVAGQRYWTVGGALSTTRESQSHLNTAAERDERSRRARGRAAAAGLVRADGGHPGVPRRPPTTCSWPGWSRAPRTSPPATRRSRSAPARRCAPTTTCSPPTAATTTRWPAARHPRRAWPS